MNDTKTYYQEGGEPRQKKLSMLNKTARIGTAIFIAIALVTGSYVIGFSVGHETARRVPIVGVMNLDSGQPEAVDFSLFWEAWLAVQKKFAGAQDVDYEAMVAGAIAGMVDSLGDPYTVFMEAEDTKMFRDDISGEFEGVGMEIGIRDDQLSVIAPLDGTPADKAGVRPGDKILQIDEAFTDNMTIDEAVSLIRGPKGTTVVLLLTREGWDAPQDISIERGVIVIPTISWELKEGNIAYIELKHFSEKARGGFQNIASEVLSSDADRIILDLRGNPGGFLEVAVDIASWFVQRGEVVVIEESNTGERRVSEARGNSAFISYPVVVLMNEGSASASEILAGALRDNRDTTLIGKKSFGKGSVQELEYLSDSSSIKITVAKWLTPKGNLIAGEGLSPDIEVELTNEDFEADRDPQLDGAIEFIKNL